MPTVPGQRLPSVGPDALPGVLVGTSAPIEVFGGGEANRRIGLAPLAEEARSIFEEEKKKADQTAVLKAAAAASALETRLKVAARQRLGEDAFKAPDDVSAEWAKATGEIEQGLTNDTQRMAFEQVKASHWRELDDAVQTHVADQRVKLNAQVTDAYLANEQTAALDAVKDGNLQRVGLAISNQKAAITDHLNQLYGGKIPEGVLEQATNVAESGVHLGVITQMISAGHDQAALAYFNANKAALHGADVAQAQRMVDVASTDGQGMRAVDDIWKSLGPKAINDPVKLETMEQALREKVGDNPQVVKAAVQELRSRAQAHNNEQAEVKATNIAAVYGAMNGGASLAQLQRMPEYLALTGTEQNQLKQHVLSEQYTAEERSFSRRQRQEELRAQEGFATYWEYQDPKRLATMSDAQVLALQPQIGRQLVNALMTQKRTVTKSEEEIRNATIDDDQFKYIANEAGLKPYDTGLSASQKATLGSLKNGVEEEIARQQGVKGKLLTRDEKATIMKRMIDDKVMLDEWGRDPEKITVTLTPEQRAKAYVPIAQIREREKKAMVQANVQGPDFVDQALGWIRKNGLVRNAAATDVEVLKTFGDRIEKAYAARRLGATKAEIEALLRGAP